MTLFSCLLRHTGLALRINCLSFSAPSIHHVEITGITIENDGWSCPGATGSAASKALRFGYHTAARKNVMVMCGSSATVHSILQCGLLEKTITMTSPQICETAAHGRRFRGEPT